MIDLKEVIDLLKKKQEEAEDRRDFVSEKMEKIDNYDLYYSDDDSEEDDDDDDETSYDEYQKEERFLDKELEVIETTIYQMEKYDSRRKEKLMTFGKALELLKKGKKVARDDWNDKRCPITCTYLTLHKLPSMKQSYICLSGFDNDDTSDMTPWSPTQTDILAEDWTEI